MAGRSTIKDWSGAVARRLGERSLLSDFGSRVYTLLIGMCVIRATATTLIILTISPAAENRADLAVIQFAIFGAVFACLEGMQAARYAVRIDGVPPFADAPLFPRFRRLLGRRFLFERPFAVGGALMFAALGWVVLVVEPRTLTAAAVLVAAIATAALAFSAYRFIPPSVIRKNAFGCELALTAVAVLANPDIGRIHKAMATTVFNLAVSPVALNDRLLLVLYVYGAAALVAAILLAIAAAPDLLAGALTKGHGIPSAPVWAMPLKQVRGSYWALVWLLTYLIYAFFGRTPAAMIVPSLALAVVGGIGRLGVFLAESAQELGEDARFPARYGTVAVILIALPHFLPCLILLFVE